jgi:hypothetical protein
MATLLGEFFSKYGVKVHNSIEDNDDTLASYA